MRTIRRLILVSPLAGIFIGGCEGGSSDSPRPIAFTPAPNDYLAGLWGLPSTMQRQTATYAASAGSVIQISDTSVVQ